MRINFDPFSRPSFKPEDCDRIKAKWNIQPEKEEALLILALFLRMGALLGGNGNTGETIQVPLTLYTDQFNRIEGTRIKWQRFSAYFRALVRCGMFEVKSKYSPGAATIYTIKCPILREIASQGLGYWETPAKPKKHLKLVG